MVSLGAYAIYYGLTHLLRLSLSLPPGTKPWSSSSSSSSSSLTLVSEEEDSEMLRDFLDCREDWRGRRGKAGEKEAEGGFALFLITGGLVR